MTRTITKTTRVQTASFQLETSVQTNQTDVITGDWLSGRLVVSDDRRSR